MYLKQDYTDKTSLLKDRPTDIDMLGRWPFARHIAIRLMEIREQIKGAFLIHIHGEGRAKGINTSLDRETLTRLRH